VAIPQNLTVTLPSGGFGKPLAEFAKIYPNIDIKMERELKREINFNMSNPN
jgi:hypothetical protein